MPTPDWRRGLKRVLTVLAVLWFTPFLAIGVISVVDEPQYFTDGRIVLLAAAALAPWVALAIVAAVVVWIVRGFVETRPGAPPAP